MEKTKNGVFQLTNEEYHASEGISRSALWLYRQNQFKYWFQYLSGTYVPVTEKEAFRLGELVHTLVLEPHLMESKYIVEPKIDKRTKAGKEDYAQFVALCEGKTPISMEHFTIAKGIQDSLYSRDVTKKLFNNTRVEQSIFWVDSDTGILCKVRPDAWNARFCIDLKTSSDASYRAFQSSAMRYGYFLQAGMIFEAMKVIGEPIEKFINVVVETGAPYACATYIMDDEAVQYGIDLFHALLRKYAVSRETGNFDDYGLQILMAPRYALEEMQE